MPKRNALKTYGEDQYYHCYNRGVGKMDIFIDDDDYAYFLSLMKRHLSVQPSRDSVRRPYPHYRDAVELVAYCLMPNHFHLLLYQKEQHGIEKLMRSVMTAYSRYFNLKQNRGGTLFEGRYLASHVGSNEYLWHVSRYIHLNPLDIRQDPRTYKYSSIAYFSGNKSAEWLRPERLIDDGGEREAYLKSLDDGADYHQLRDQLKHLLAN